MDLDKPTPHPDNSFRSGDPRFIDVTSPAERAFWIKALETSEHELLSAVDAVGTSAQKVKDYLGGSRS